VTAGETSHSPEALDPDLPDFSPVYYRTVLKGMAVEEATFAIQRPRSPGAMSP
jgi:hypothetical protein